MTRVSLDTGRKSVELDTNDMFQQKFMYLVFQALEALDYTTADIEYLLKEYKEQK